MSSFAERTRTDGEDMRNGALLLAVGCLAVSTEAQTPSWWAATGLFAALAVGAEMIRCIGAAMQRDDAKS